MVAFFLVLILMFDVMVTEKELPGTDSDKTNNSAKQEPSINIEQTYLYTGEKVLEGRVAYCH